MHKITMTVLFVLVTLGLFKALQSFIQLQKSTKNHVSKDVWVNEKLNKMGSLPCRNDETGIKDSIIVVGRDIGF